MAGRDARSDEAVLLALGMLVRAGKAGLSAEVLQEVADWADLVRTDYALLELALRGELLIGWAGDQPDFKAPTDEELRRFRAEAAALGLRRPP